MVKVPVTVTQPQLCGWLPSDPASQEPEARKVTGPVSQPWGHSVGQAWAPRMSLAIPRAPGFPRADTRKAWSHCLFAFADDTEPPWKPGLPQAQPRTAPGMMPPTQGSPCVPLSQRMCCGWRCPAHSPQHHPGAGQAAVPVVELLDDGHGQLHEVPCMEAQGGNRSLA